MRRESGQALAGDTKCSVELSDAEYAEPTTACDSSPVEVEYAVIRKPKLTLTTDAENRADFEAEPEAIYENATNQNAGGFLFSGEGEYINISELRNGDSVYMQDNELYST